MPRDRPFIDSEGVYGSPKKRLRIEKDIQFSFNDEYFSIDISKVKGKKVTVLKSNMKELAQWILSSLEKRNATRE